MRITQEMVNRITEEMKLTGSMPKTDYVAFFGRVPLIKEYNSLEDRIKYEVFNSGTCMLFNLKDDEIEYYVRKKEVLEKYPEAKIIDYPAASCPIMLFHYVDTIIGKAIVIEKIDFQRYKLSLMLGKNASEVLCDRKYVFIFQNGQMFANCGSIMDTGDSSYLGRWYKQHVEDTGFEFEEWSSNILDRIDGLARNAILEDEWSVIFKNTISKVFNSTTYFRGNIKKIDYHFFTFIDYVMNYKEPHKKSGKRQEMINRLSEYPILENSVSKKKAENNPYDYAMRTATLNRVDCPENVAVIRIFPDAQSQEDIMRHYITKDDIFSAFRNHSNEWVLISNSNINTYLHNYHIEHIKDYSKDIFAGTRLQFILPLVEPTINVRGALYGENLYPLLKQNELEEFMKLKVANFITNEGTEQLDLLDIRNMFGQINKKKKGFYRKIGLNKKQFEYIFERVELMFNMENLYGALSISSISKYAKSSRVGLIVRSMKEIFAENVDADVYEDIIDISNVDNKTFLKVLNAITLFGEDYLWTRDDENLELNDCPSYEHIVATIRRILLKIRQNFSNEKFNSFLDYLPKLVLARANKRITRWDGETVTNTVYAITYYLDYLIMQVAMCENTHASFDLYFKSAKDIIETHDRISNLFNEWNAYKQTPEYMREAFLKLSSKWKEFELSDDNFCMCYPQNPEEIIIEGQKLRHCVGSYVRDVADGKTTILFIRKLDEREEPFFTLELRDGKVRQVHGYCNRNIETEDGLTDFIRKWADRKKVEFSIKNSHSCLAV